MVNTFDKNEEAIIELNSLTEEQKNSLIRNLEEKGADLTIKEFSKITGFNYLSGKATMVFASLCQLAHSSSHHKDSFENDIKQSKVSKENIEKISALLNKFSDKAIEELNLKFESRRAANDDKPKIHSMNTDISLKKILDEKENKIGYLPFIIIDLILTEFHNRRNTKRIYATIDDLEYTIEALTDTLHDAKKEAKEYKESLNDRVVSS